MLYGSNWPQFGQNSSHFNSASKRPAEAPRPDQVGSPGPAVADGRDIANIRFNDDNTITIEMTDGATFGPFPLPAGPAGAPSPGSSGVSVQLHFADGNAPTHPPSTSSRAAAGQASVANWPTTALQDDRRKTARKCVEMSWGYNSLLPPHQPTLSVRTPFSIGFVHENQ